MDLIEIKKTLDVFRHDNSLVEVRIFNTIKNSENYSGIFNNDDDFIREVSKFDKDPYILYFVFNELKDATEAFPQLNKFIYGASAIKDSDVKYRRWLMLDFDPIREGNVKDIPSTDEELNNAHMKAIEVYRFLESNGFPQPIVCESGNGYHLMYRLENIENSKRVLDDIKGFLNYIAMRFTDSKVDCDTKNINAARLTKLYSTKSRKGGNTQNRPHRFSRIIKVPDEIKTVDYKKIEEFSKEYSTRSNVEPINNQRSSYSNNGNSFNIDDFLSSNGIEVLKEDRGYDNSRKIVLKTCPFHPEHGKDSAIYVSDKGITFTCFHQTCSGNTWKDLRLMFDPHAYDKQNFNPYNNFGRQYVNSLPNKREKVFEVKKEDDKIGKKWLKMSDIKKIDLSSIESIKTGFVKLDSAIVGLNLGEVTILSGSNSSGKSSWLNMLILNVAQQKYKSCVWSGELSDWKLKGWIQMAAAGRDFLTPSKFSVGKFYIKDEVSRKIDKWLDNYLYVYNNDYGSKVKQLMSDMNDMVKEGCKLFILDNLFSLDIDFYEGDKNTKQKDFILELSSFAKKENVHIIIVCHPRKQTDFLRKEAIAGSADLSNAADNCIIIHRVNNDFKKRGAEFFGDKTIQQYFEFGNVIEVCKNRMYGVVDFLCGMYYEIESRRFTSYPNEQIRYGWQEDAVQSELPIQPYQQIDDSCFTQSEEDCPF